MKPMRLFSTKTSLLSLLLIVICLFFAGSNQVLAQATEDVCAADQGPVTCTACATKSSPINAMSGLPRPRMDLKPTPRNFAYYDNFYSCLDSADSSQECFMDNFDMNRVVRTPEESTDTYAYFNSLFLYACAGAFFFLIVILGFISLCCGRYVCGLCIPGGMGCCASSYPTQKDNPDKRRCCCPCLGFVEDDSAKTGFTYPCWEKFMAHICTWIFCALLVIFMIIVATLGVDGLGNSAKSAVRSGDNLLSTLGSSANIVNTTIHTTVRETLSDSVIDISNTMINDGQFQEFIDANNRFMDITNDFTSVSVTKATFESLRDKSANIRDHADQYTSGSLQAIAFDVNQAYADPSSGNSFTKSLKSYYTALNDATPGTREFVTSLSNASSSFDAFNAQVGSFRSNSNVGAIAEVRTSADEARLRLGTFRDKVQTASLTSLNSSIRAALEEVQRTGNDLKTTIPELQSKISQALPVLGTVKNLLKTLRSALPAAQAFQQLDQSEWPFVATTLDTASLDNVSQILVQQYDANPNLRPSIAALRAVIAQQAKTDSDDIFNTTFINEELLAIKFSAQALPTLIANVKTYVQNFNDRIYELPQDVMDSLATLDPLPDKAGDYVASLELIDATFRDTVRQIREAGLSFQVLFDNLVELDSLYDLLNLASTTNVSQTSAVFSAVDGMRNEILAFYSAPTATFDFERFATLIVTLNDQLLTALGPNTSIDAMLANVVSFESGLAEFDGPAFTTVVDDTLDIVQELFDAGRGYCSENPNTICTLSASPSDCQGTCVPYARVCFDGSTNSVSSTTCFKDSTCSNLGAGSYCIAGAEAFQARADLLVHGLVTFSIESTSGVSSVVSALQSSFVNAAPQADIDAVVAEMDDIVADSRLTPFKSLIVQGMEKIYQTVVTHNQAHNIALFLNTMSSLYDTLSTKAADTLDTLISMKTSLDDIRNDSISEMQRVNGFLSLPRNCLIPLGDELRRANWSTMLIYDGPKAVFDDLVRLVNGASLCFNDLQDWIVMPYPVIEPSTTDSVVDILDKYYSLANTSALDGPGSLYQFMETATINQVDKDDSSQNRWDVDLQGDQYPDGKYCYTTLCLDNTIDYYTKSNLNEYVHGTVSISPNATIKVFLVIPAIIVVLLLLASIFGFCCGRGCQKCSVHMTNCSLFFMFCQNVFGFIFVGMALFPILIAVSDGCQSAANVGDRYLATQSQSFCDEMTGVYSPSTETCTIDSTDYNLNVSFNMRSIYRSLLSNSCSASDGISSVYTQMQTQLPGVIDNEVEKRFEPGEYLEKVQPVMKGTINRFSGRLGQDLSNTVQMFSNDVGCSNLSSSTTALTEAFCCKTADAFYWIIAGWYLLLWFTCFCGVPAALLGRKRFPRQPWGPEYEDAITKKANGGYADKARGAVVAPEQQQIYYAPNSPMNYA